MIENIFITYCQDGGRMYLIATCNGDVRKTLLGPPKRPATVTNIVHSMIFLVKQITHNLITKIPDEAKDVLLDMIRSNDDGYTVFDSHGYTIYLHIKCLTNQPKQKRYTNDIINHAHSRTENFTGQAAHQQWL